MNIGDKYLKIDNVEDISSIKIFKVDDVFEISLRENAYECTLIQYKNDGKRPWSKN